MKYIVIIVVVFAVMRIDFILGLFDKMAKKAEPAPVEVDASDIGSKRETVPLKDDPNFKQTPKKTFFALLEDFHSSPVPEIRERANAFLKANPTLFGPKLDAQLESTIFQWRDLLINNDQETVNFMLDLMNVLQGENLEMMKRFFSLWMDINMEHFIAAYSRTKDSNCSIATTFGDNLPEEEKRNEIYEREAALKAYVAKENIPPHHKALATNCLLVLGIEIAKFPPPTWSQETAQPAIEPQPGSEAQAPGVTP